MILLHQYYFNIKSDNSDNIKGFIPLILCVCVKFDIFM